MRPRAALLPAIALLLGAAAPAPPSPEQAKVLEAQITAWLTTVTGSLVALPSRPVELTPEGDHYVVRAPLGTFGAVEPPDAAFTATARPLGGTRWALDDQRFPSSLTIHTTEPAGTAPDKPHKVDVTYRIQIGQQDAHSVFDTAFATATAGSFTAAPVDLLKEGGAGASLSHFDQIVSQSSTQPLDPAHADLLSDVTATGYAMKGQAPDGKDVALQIDRLHIVSALSAVAHEQILPLIQIASGLGKLAQNPGKDGLTPAQKATLHELVQQAHDMLTGGKIDETAEHLKFDVDGSTGALDHAGLSLSADAPANALSASATVSMDGLALDSLPPELASYVPTRFSIHPTVSNIDLAVLTKMALDATAPGPNPPAPDGSALFAKGGIRYGFDGLALDVAGVSVTGTGQFTSPTAKSFIGQAELSARGLDTLIARAQTDPNVAPAVPVIIFLKGIAKTAGDRSVWQITVDNAKILVNGVDLSSLAGTVTK